MAALDAFSDIWAAHSLRLLRTAYAGSAIRVRRSSDNAEADIGFDGEDLDEAALLAHVGAGNGFVVTWYDQSGSARHVTQSDTGRQPRIVNGGVIDRVNNERPAMVGDGSDDGWGTTGQALGGTEITFLQVLARNSAGTEYATGWAREATSDAGQSWGATGGAFDDWQGDDIYFVGDGFEGDPRYVAEGPFDHVTGTVVYDATLDPGTLSIIRADGVTLTARTSSTGGTIVSDTRNYTVCCNNAGNGENSWAGNICELIIFNVEKEASIATLRADAMAYWQDDIPVEADASRSFAFIMG